MDTVFLFEIARSVWREIIAWRAWLVAAFLLVNFAVLGVGLLWPETYQTRALLYADETNIIKPLLKGRAEVTSIDRSQQARELIYTRRILSRVARDTGLLPEDATESQEEKVIKSLRDNIQIRAKDKNYFEVLYKSRDQEKSFRVLNSVVSSFIKDSADRKRQESQDAYQFISEQVKSYKNQLVKAEQQLKDFRSKNTDGTPDQVNARISQLRQDLEEVKLTIGATEARKHSLEQQLKSESKNLDEKDKVDAQEDRLKALKQRLDVLRLSYQETYPDIVSLKEQIKSLEVSLEAMKDDSYMRARSDDGDTEKNPLYEDLRKNFAETQANLTSQIRRKQSIEGMLQDEYKRAKRVASREAERSELVRDYSVMKGIYEEMLQRKESARLSMALDVEGQGVKFKVQEPPAYPLEPSGLRFIHFALAAPVVGLAVALGLVIVYVLLDPRVRSPIQLMSGMPQDVEMLAVIPHVNSSFGERMLRIDMIVISIILFLSACAYSIVIWARLNAII